jgi:2-oxo-4-hydroxy-4-carboxy-5-ureidoimidazoline decarboxylase
MVEERARYTLEQINQMTLLPYARTMAVVFANASWVPVLAFPNRPFRTLEHLYESMVQVLKGSDQNSQLQVIEQQPDLINPPPPEEVPEFQLFHCDQVFHQQLSVEEKHQLEGLQQQYLEKFGFGLVFDPAHKTVPELHQEILQRLERTPEEELQQAIIEASNLAHSRLQELVIE